MSNKPQPETVAVLIPREDVEDMAGTVCSTSDGHLRIAEACRQALQAQPEGAGAAELSTESLEYLYACTGVHTAASDNADSGAVDAARDWLSDQIWSRRNPAATPSTEHKGGGTDG